MNKPGCDPFFIVGCGRSGTTLLRTLLNRHSKIGIPQESLFITDYLRSGAKTGPSVLKRLIVKEPELVEWGIRPKIGDLEACHTVAEMIERLHQVYLEPLGKSRWGQKTPRFVRSIDLLLEHFPGAGFVHVVRDPRAVVSSLIQSDVHRSNAYFGARRWLRDVSLGLDSETSHPGRILRIRYEDLVADTTAALTSLSSFLGFDYEPSMSAGSSSGAEEYSRFYETIHANLNLPPTDRFVSKWKERLTPRDVEVVEAICNPLMTELGYEPSLQPPPAAVTRTFKMEVERAWGVLRQAARYMRFRRRYLFFLIYRKWRLGLLREFLAEVNY
jgi:hypothetical protein